MAQFLQVILPGVIAIMLIMVAVGFLVRAIFGPAAAANYGHGIGATVSFVAHHLYRFVRWTLTTHWQFWLGVTVGVLVTLYFTGHLTRPEEARALGATQVRSESTITLNVASTTERSSWL